jgi:hypothetical protein
MNLNLKLKDVKGRRQYQDLINGLTGISSGSIRFKITKRT